MRYLSGNKVPIHPENLQLSPNRSRKNYTTVSFLKDLETHLRDVVKNAPDTGNMREATNLKCRGLMSMRKRLTIPKVLMLLQSSIWMQAICGFGLWEDSWATTVLDLHLANPRSRCTAMSIPPWSTHPTHRHCVRTNPRHGCISSDSPLGPCSKLH